jgi:hypothetical protein
MISITVFSTETMTPHDWFGSFYSGSSFDQGGFMSNLNGIKERHILDHWKDAIFIALAVILTALSVGSVTSKAAGHPAPHQWSLTVVENPELAK